MTLRRPDGGQGGGNVEFAGELQGSQHHCTDGSGESRTTRWRHEGRGSKGIVRAGSALRKQLWTDGCTGALDHTVAASRERPVVGHRGGSATRATLGLLRRVVTPVMLICQGSPLTHHPCLCKAVCQSMSPRPGPVPCTRTPGRAPTLPPAPLRPHLQPALRLLGCRPCPPLYIPHCPAPFPTCPHPTCSLCSASSARCRSCRATVSWSLAPAASSASRPRTATSRSRSWQRQDCTGREKQGVIVLYIEQSPSLQVGRHQNAAAWLRGARSSAATVPTIRMERISGQGSGRKSV